MLFLPGRKRKDILILAAIVILALIIIEALFLLFGRMRLDLGRPAFIFLGAGLLSLWLAGGTKKAAVDAFKRGSDFLTAGRLEPAFAEFRRCDPTESLATVMYKLSLAFEEQAKPERAEAVPRFGTTPGWSGCNTAITAVRHSFRDCRDAAGQH